MQATAILTTGVIILKNKKVLLVKHKENATHLTGKYGIPAGRLDGDENIIDACIRETEEETGLVINKKDLKRLPKVYIADIERKDGVNKFAGIIFTTSKFSGQLKSQHETIPKWIEISELKNIDLLSNVEEMIEDVLNLKL